MTGAHALLKVACVSLARILTSSDSKVRGEIGIDYGHRDIAPVEAAQAGGMRHFILSGRKEVNREASHL
jgi:hypothetical protein